MLEIKNLKTRFNIYDGVVKALEGVNLEVKEGEIFGIVGETGCGKSVTSYSVLHLLPNTAEIVSGSVKLNGEVIIPPQHIQYAGFWKRFWAHIIDQFVISLLAIPLLLLDLTVLYALGPLGVIFYYVYFNSSDYQATPGKMAQGIIVVGPHGKLSPADALGRFFAKNILGVLTFGIGFLAIGFTDTKQGFHDKILNTNVIYKFPTDRIKEIRGGEIAMIFQDPLSALNPVMKVKDQISEVIRQHQKEELENRTEKVVSDMELDMMSFSDNAAAVPTLRDIRLNPHEGIL